MPDLDDFIDKVVGGEASAAREQLQGMLAGKTADALETRKQEITDALFNDGEEAEVEEEPVEGEEEVTSQYGDNPAIENDEIQEIDPFSGQPVEGEVEEA
tara:strand:+ start:1153 stop:1452 length:300 start_codon:yes stop_codon:yes gene_type:complete